jgi:A/G-specific adenine glycosylase
VFVKNLLKWFKKNKRNFPWRETSDPYKVLIAEIMLQKTIANNVKIVYPKFIEKYPSLKVLSQAKVSELENEIKRLGLFRKRARFLKRIAKQFVKKYGCIPSLRERLSTLPGIGRYVCDALLCFAFGKDVVLIDTNVRRVIKRVFSVKKDEKIRAILEQILPRGQAKEFNLALIDLANIICKPNKPLCWKCPLKKICLKNY